MSRNFAVVLNEGAEAHFLPTLALHLRSGKGGAYFLAQQIEPNGVYLHMVLASDGDDASDKRGIELHIPHNTVRYVLAAQDLSRVGF